MSKEQEIREAAEAAEAAAWSDLLFKIDPRDDDMYEAAVDRWAETVDTARIAAANARNAQEPTQ